MIAKPKQRKRLDWYMVLAMFVLLISFSTSPRAMDSETIVTGSSASQHALGVDPENIDGDGEDRVLSNFRAERIPEYLGNIFNSVECKQLMTIERRLRFTVDEARRLKKEYNDLEEKFVRRLLELPNEQILAVIVYGKGKEGFESTAARLEASLLLCSDEKVLGILAAGKKVRKLRPIAVRLKQSILLKPDDKVLGIIAAGKDVLELKATAESLEISLLTRWLFDGRKDAVFAYLREGQSSWIEFLKSPLWTALIADRRYDNKVVFKMVFEMVEPQIGGEELGRLISELKGPSSSIKKLATGLGRLWWEAGYSGYVAFKAFGLQAKAEMMKSPLWNLWVSYLRKLAEKEGPGGTPKEDAELVALALHGHETDNDVKKLTATGKTDVKTSKFDKRLKREFEPWLKLGN